MNFSFQRLSVAHLRKSLSFWCSTRKSKSGYGEVSRPPLHQARKRSTKINFLDPETARGLPREGGGEIEKFVPSLESLPSLGFRGREAGMSREFCRDVQDPWGCSKSLCKKSSCAFFVPYFSTSNRSYSDILRSPCRTPRGRWGQGPGSVDPRHPAGLPFQVLQSLAFRDTEKLSSIFPKIFPEISSGNPRTDPRNSHSLLEFSDTMRTLLGHCKDVGHRSAWYVLNF